MISRIKLRVPPTFKFPSVVYSHGWSALLPFHVSDNPLTLTRVLRISARSIVQLDLTAGKGHHPLLAVRSVSSLNKHSLSAIEQLASSMLQTDLNLQPFYDRVRNDSRFSWAETAGAGRMLRGESFFEDAVKTILTTNCSWSLTTSMNANLIHHFGARNSLGFVSFPSPEPIADSSSDYLRKECKLGYRADYVYELAVRCANGTYDLESFRTTNARAPEIYHELVQIKGIGGYAAANLMRMLGKFDYLGLDSWCRNKIAELYGNGTPLPDNKIAPIYDGYGEWKGLAMWLDVTRHWYRDKFPLL